MDLYHFSRQELVDRARLSAEDLKRVQMCRYQHTRLGFAYQLGFVRLHHRLPLQEPLEMVEELLTYVSVQVNIPDSAIGRYLEQPRTIITHQQEICDYLECSADRMRNLKEERRYSVLVCFLQQVYQDTIDHMVDMHGKLMLKVENRAQEDVDTEMRRQRRLIRSSLHSFHKLGQIVLDDTVPDGELRNAVFREVGKDRLSEQLTATESWLTGKYSQVFNLVVQRFYYLRQFSPTLLESLAFRN